MRHGDRPDRRAAAGAGREGGGPRPRGPDDLAGGRPLPGHAALPGPPAVPGPQLPDAARDPGDRRPAVGPGQRRRPRLHGRVRDGDVALRRPHGRPRPHDRRRRHALVRRRQRRRAPDRLRAGPRRRRRRCRRSSPAACSSTPPAFRGVDCLPKGSPIDAAEMDAICAAQGVDGPAVGRGRHPDRLHGPLARRRADGRPQDARPRHLGGPLAPGARRRRDRDRHRDLRGPAGARPGPDRQPAARAHRCCSSRTASTSWRASTSRSWRASASTSSSSSPFP